MKLDYRKTFLLGLGFLAVSAVWSIYTNFVPLFLSQKFHLSPATITFFISLDNVAALLIQPQVGVWSDKIRTPIGRRMPFILLCAPISALAFAFIPIAPILPIFILCTSTLLISMAVWRTPVVALVADVTPSPLRSQASGVISFMGGIGSVIAYFGGGKLFRYNHAYPFWLGSVVVLAAAISLLFWVKEPKTQESDSTQATPNQLTLWESFQTVYRDSSAFRVLLTTFFLMIGFTSVEGVFSLYAMQHLGFDGGASARLLGFVSFSFLIFALPSGTIGARFGRKPTVMSGLAGMATFLFAIFILPVKMLQSVLFTVPRLGDFPLVGILLMVTGISYAFVLIHLMPMLSDMAEDNQIGTYTGLYYLVASLAAIVGLNLNGIVSQLCGGNYNTAMLVASISLTVAFFVMAGVKKGEQHGDRNPPKTETRNLNQPLLDAP